MIVTMLGISHHTAPLAVRERLAIGDDTRTGATEQFQSRFPGVELAVVSTCNRVEWYVARPSRQRPSIDELRDFVADFCGVERADLDGASIHRQNRTAVEHLFRVTSGLESMVLGEPQVLGQVRKTYEQAVAMKSVGPALHKLFQQALAIGKQVRAETGIDTGRMSVGSVAVDFARQIFDRFDDKTVLCIGAGEIAELALRHLQMLGPHRLWLVNRSVSNALALADELALANTEGGVRSMDDLDELLVEADIVLTSTGSVQPILTADRLKLLPNRRHFRPLFMVDLAVPRDIDQQVGTLTNVYLYNMDDLQHVVQQTHSLRGQEADKANEMLLAAAGTCIAEIQTQDIDELIRQLRQRLHGLGELEQQRTLRKLQAADEPDVGVLLEQHTERLINKILHIPLSQLARHQPVSKLTFASEALRRLFGLSDDAATGQEDDKR